MHKPLNIAERAKLQLAEEIEIKPVLSRRDKLMRLAEIARAGRPNRLKTFPGALSYGNYDNRWYIFDGVEYLSIAALGNYFHPLSVFDAALKDPVLYDAGLRPDHGDSVSVARAMEFFELTKAQMHPMSCDCGGAITNAEMASRVQTMAA